MPQIPILKIEDFLIVTVQTELHNRYAVGLQTDILRETVRISKERLHVKERLKELGKISDNELETFRQRFFSDQDSYFEQQIRLIDAQERLRLAMRYFELAPTEGNQK